MDVISLLLATGGFICLFFVLAWYMLSDDRGAREPISALAGATLIGLGATVVVYFLEGWLVNLPPDGGVHLPLTSLFMTMLLVGVIEEGAKFLPIVFTIARGRFFNEHTDGVIYFGLAGAAFGTAENILYALNFGPGALAGRSLLTPFFHAATAGILGYFFARSKLSAYPKWRVYALLAGFMVLHGIYDFMLSIDQIWLIIPAFCITIGLQVGLFFCYQSASSRDGAAGLAAVGHNSYCRACGRFNPRHSVYCSSCGQLA